MELIKDVIVPTVIELGIVIVIVIVVKVHPCTAKFVKPT